jgi:FixJ family two-component response regulator
MLPASPAVQPQKTNTWPRVLVVDDEADLVEVINDVVCGLQCKVTVARTVAQAKKLLKGESFELMLADVNLPDGDGLSLLPALRRHQPVASAIVITGAPSVDGAITAMRSGAVDFLAKPFDTKQLVDRVQNALQRQSLVARQEKRLVRLRDAVKRLGIARRMVSKKVDLLCNDLVSAYGELSKQLDVVRTQENFRKSIEQARDLEQLLCHTMDWLLRQLGYANVALWLAGEDGDFQLGAYMKYTIAGDEPVVNAMKNGLLESTARDGFLHIKGTDLKDNLSPEEYATLVAQDILTMSCTYLGEPLATIVFFRDASSYFNENDEATLRAIAPIFATALATVVRDPAQQGEDGEDPVDGDSPFSDGPVAEGDDTDNPRGGRRGKNQRNNEDWWKRGEPPPF